MIQKVNDSNRDKYVEFITRSPKGHFAQSPQWARVKDNWKNEVILSVDEKGEILGAMSLLIRKVPLFPATIMYSPRGPVCDCHDERVLRELLDGARAIAKEYKSYVLKIDPDILSSDRQFEQLVRSLGFKVQNESKNFEGIQPRFVFRLDIAGKTEDEAMEIFHSKTRYNIRLAQRKGVTSRVGGREDLQDFHRIMEETGTRDAFITRSLSYFQKMYDEMAPDHLRLYMADFEGQPIAGTLAIRYGNKVWYLYGASSNAHRNVMPNYLLQWEMIKWALESGCEIYDFRGVSGDLDESNPLYGLYRFKKGFNGDFCEFIGELNYVFNPIMHTLVDKGEKTYRVLRRKLGPIRQFLARALAAE